ncbi:MAG TPA: heavy metal translocating P-type ATPase, partial [Saprospiraceae bacterium]|nr:heavy metal translocating P-type ATPase [Saprospiraceae bacterium]
YRITAFVLLISGIILDHYEPFFYDQWVRIGLYLLAYIPVGWPVLKEAWESIAKGEVFSEFMLMGIATLGAMGIEQYPEAVAVMLFYSIGETFQTLAVQRAKANIKMMLDQRPDEVTIVNGDKFETVKAATVPPGTIVRLNPGEKAALDGILLSASGSFNTAALTGESVPATKFKGEEILAGMISVNESCRMEVSRPYEDSKLSGILRMVQDASSRKAPTELFIRKFAKVYTPIVVFLAVAICLLPFFFVSDYIFSQWLYRALIFLVISCPCALVISIPLGYFGGIGAASRNGILVKGGNYLDTLAGIRHVVVDKTGTMTRGNFEVREVEISEGFNRIEVLTDLKALQGFSTHPIAGAIQRYVQEEVVGIRVEDVLEIAGKGMSGTVNGKHLLAGNLALMQVNKIPYDVSLEEIEYTLVAIAVDDKFAGYVTIADEIKPNAAAVVRELADMGVELTMLSGDSSKVVAAVAREIGIRKAYGSLLPEDKVAKANEIKEASPPIAFVGDGMNDAPVLALSDVGIAMGGLGSDMAIESADVVIQDDDIKKIPLSIRIGKKTKTIVWQNILFAFGVKAAVLILGASGEATMWEAVFADVGVALIAVANAVRIQRM